METATLQNIKTSSNKLSRPLQFVMFIRFLFGYCYKLSNITVIRVFAKCYCSIATIASIAFYYYCVNVTTTVSFVYCLIITSESGINRFISFLTEDANVIKFLAKYDNNSYITHIFAVLTMFPVLICVIIATKGESVTNVLIVIYMDMSHLVGRFTSLYTIYEFRNKVRSLRKSLADMKDKHLCEDDKIACVEDITANAVTLYNDFFVLVKELRVKVGIFLFILLKYLLLFYIH